MKKRDMMIIIILCLIIGIGYLIYINMQTDTNTIEVYYQNELIDTLDISVDASYTYTGTYGTFTLEVEDRQYHATNVDCPNHDCEKMGWIKEGSTKSIICLPNEIYVIQSNAEEQIEVGE
ncbi:MAG: NusG domain II-containing protein [Erysipelotrichaceae bacterium]|nr:NusG domain II-containing protein [Erysipelotrichaceae bacterium]